MSNETELGRALVRPVCERLRVRWDELEEAILARLSAIEGGDAEAEAEAHSGRQRAVRACLELALVAIEAGSGWDEMHLVPETALVQARRAARSGEDVGPVLRRYVVGGGVLWGFFIREVLDGGMSEAERAGALLEGSAAMVAMGAQLLPMVGSTHAKELAFRCDPLEERTAAVVAAIIDCVPVPTDGIPYDFDGRHLGLVATGAGAPQAVRALAAEWGCDHLCLSRPNGVTWAWLQVRDSFEVRSAPDTDRIERGVRIAIGEERVGRLGFRTTHREAQAALRVAVWQRQPITWYRDVLLLVSAIEDETCREALISVYVEPLERAPEKNPTLKETLAAFFDSERNTSATAALLRVDRRTATNRLRAVEERLGFSIHTHAAELEIALRLDRLQRRKPQVDEQLHTLDAEPTHIKTN